MALSFIKEIYRRASQELVNIPSSIGSWLTQSIFGTLLQRCYISHFSVAVINHDQTTYKELILAYGFRGRSPSWYKDIGARDRHGLGTRSRVLTSSNASMTEREMEMTGLWALPQWCTSSSKAIASRQQTASPSRDQVTRCSNGWDHGKETFAIQTMTDVNGN